MNRREREKQRVVAGKSEDGNQPGQGSHIFLFLLFSTIGWFIACRRGQQQHAGDSDNNKHEDSGKKAARKTKKAVMDKKNSDGAQPPRCLCTDGPSRYCQVQERDDPGREIGRLVGQVGLRRLSKNR